MNRSAFRMIAVLGAACALLPAQTASSRPQLAVAGDSGIVLPGLLPPTPGPMDPVAFWTVYLNLDAGQQASVKTILADQQAASAANRSGLDQARSALNAAAKANSADSEIDRLAANLGAALAQAVSAQAKAYARFYAVLTTDQKEKMESLPFGLSVSTVDGGAAGAAGKQ